MNKATTNVQASELEREHRELDQRVARLAKRTYLTAEEQQEVASLKKRKLQARDQLEALRRATS